MLDQIMKAELAQNRIGVMGKKGTRKCSGCIGCRTRSTNKEIPTANKNVQKTGSVNVTIRSKPPWPPDCSPSVPKPPTTAVVIRHWKTSDRTGVSNLLLQWPKGDNSQCSRPV